MGIIRVNWPYFFLSMRYNPSEKFVNMESTKVLHVLRLNIADCCRVDPINICSPFRQQVLLRRTYVGSDTFRITKMEYESFVILCVCVWVLFVCLRLPKFPDHSWSCHRSSAYISCRHSSHFVFIYICHIHFYGLILYEEEWIRVVCVLFCVCVYWNTQRNGFEDKDL